MDQYTTVQEILQVSVKQLSWRGLFHTAFLFDSLFWFLSSLSFQNMLSESRWAGETLPNTVLGKR
jgi:hypothetical protein